MLRRLLAPLAALALLSGCAGLLAPPTSPGQVADRTTLDERAALGVETAYAGFRAIVETATDLGLVRGQLAADMQIYNRRVYALVQTARRAYDAGNARSYAEATAQAMALIAEASAKIKGD